MAKLIAVKIREVGALQVLLAEELAVVEGRDITLPGDLGRKVVGIVVVAGTLFQRAQVAELLYSLGKRLVTRVVSSERLATLTVDKDQERLATYFHP